MMNTRPKRNAWAGRVVPVGMLVVAGIALAEAVRFPESAGDIPGPALAPLLLAGALGLVAISLLFRRGEGNAPEAPGEPWPALGMLLAALCGYALLLPLFGFISGTAVLLAACLKIFGHPVGVRGWAFALGAAFVIWAVFDKLMRVPLPQGWIG